MATSNWNRLRPRVEGKMAQAPPELLMAIVGKVFKGPFLLALRCESRRIAAAEIPLFHKHHCETRSSITLVLTLLHIKKIIVLEQKYYYKVSG